MAGLALMASLLVALLLVQARHTRQSASAERRLRAAAAADALLADWWQHRSTFPRASSGWVGGDTELSWRTGPVGNPAVEDLRARVVRLEVVDERPGPTAGEVLVSVDVVLDEPTGERSHGETANPPTQRVHGG